MTTRVLPESEWHRIEASQLPLLLAYMRPEDTDIVVVEDGDRIVACMGVLRVTHLEGVWIDPEYKNVANRLLRETYNTMRKYPDQFCIAGAADDRMRDVLNRMGGVKVPMDTYVLNFQGSDAQ